MLTLHGLTPKQARFVTFFLDSRNGTDAATKAGYASPATESCDLLKNPKIIAALHDEEDARQKASEITTSKILRELAKIAFADPSDVMEWGVKEIAHGYDGDGKKLSPDRLDEAALIRYVEQPYSRPFDSSELPDNVKAAIQSVEMTKDGFKIKLHDKSAAMDKIARILGMYAPEKQEHSGPGGEQLPAPVLNMVQVFALPDNGRLDQVLEGQSKLLPEPEPVEQKALPSAA